MTNRQLYDKIYDIVNNYIYWQAPYKSDKISENIATDIVNFLLERRKTITYIDLGDNNE